ncbi:hypothetical protein FHS10_001196 [Mucilaginibacter dorajii]|nr:hypothetical protein [Mucilaginibacter dorajii]
MTKDLIFVNLQTFLAVKKALNEMRFISIKNLQGLW